jgi:hypothetical protein
LWGWVRVIGIRNETAADKTRPQFFSLISPDDLIKLLDIIVIDVIKSKTQRPERAKEGVESGE